MRTNPRIISISGKLGDLVFYIRNGKQCVRRLNKDYNGSLSVQLQSIIGPFTCLNKEKMKKMITKSLLRTRLEVALGQKIPKPTFTWFFGYFCDVYGLPSNIRTAKQLDEATVNAFSEYAGYDLRFPIPLPLTAQK